MSRKTQGENKPVADIAMTRGYLIITDAETYPDGVEYTFLAKNGGRTGRTDSAKWFDSVADAIDEIYKLNIKPSRTGGAMCPLVVLAYEHLTIEQLAFECAINDGEGGAE